MSADRVHLIPFTPPDHSLGLPVLFFLDGKTHGPDCTPYHAVVTSPVGRQVDLVCFDGENGVVFAESGVRHVADPARQSVEHAGRGAWDYAPWWKALLAIPALRKHLADPLEGEDVEDLKREAYGHGIDIEPLWSKADLSAAVAVARDKEAEQAREAETVGA